MHDELKDFKIFDSHFHIIDPRFPLVANDGYLPDHFSCEDYLNRTRQMQLAGGAIVSSSFQAIDQNYLRDALARLGPCFVGVTQLPASVSEAEILTLNESGVRGIRFNLKRGGSEDIAKLETMAKRVHELVGWHVELYADASTLSQLCPILVSLPAVSIDHLGLSKQGLPVLLKLVERGVHVKASGFGRVDFDVRTALRDIDSANPRALMFGTDLPSTRAPRAYSDEDPLLVVEALGEGQARDVLYNNAVAFYRQKPASQ
jgi:predicted TIM-barrel fold metal-dependent hydrolase